MLRISLHRVRQQVEAGSHRDQLRSNSAGELGESVEIDGEALSVDRAFVDVEPVQTSGAGRAVGDVTTDRRRRNDDRVPRPAGGHEGVEVGERAGAHTNFGETRSEHAARQIGGDDLDLLDRFEAHLVLGAGVAERWARAEPRRQRRLGSRVHHVGRRVEVDALDLMDLAIALDQRFDSVGDGVAGQPCNGGPDRVFTLLRADWQPPAHVVRMVRRVSFRVRVHGGIVACFDRPVSVRRGRARRRRSRGECGRVDAAWRGPDSDESSPLSRRSAAGRRSLRWSCPRRRDRTPRARGS